MIVFEPKEYVKYSDIDKYDVQGFIYSLLKIVHYLTIYMI